jgi:hypothetical protein
VRFHFLPAALRVAMMGGMNDVDFSSLHAVFNYAEAGLWFVIALVLAARLRMRRPWRWLVPVAFGCFGVSDLIEVQTGAWWEPWWLFVLKAVCVVVFLLAWRAF